MSNTAFDSAIRLADKMAAEQKIQRPDYEWLRIKHEKKMRIRALKIQAQVLEKFFKAIS